MGTLSENQTQKHNKEENRPGREDLRAGAGARRALRRGSEGGSETGRDFGPVRWQQRAPGLRATGRPGRSPKPAAAPTAHGGAGKQVSLLIVNWWFSLLVLVSAFTSVFPSPPSAHSPSAREQHRDVTGSQMSPEQRGSSLLPESQGPAFAEMTNERRLKDPFGGCAPSNLQQRGH